MMRKVVIFVTALALLGAGAAVALGAGGPSENGDQIRLQLQDGSCLETTTVVVPETSVPDQTQDRDQDQDRLRLRDGSCEECPRYADEAATETTAPEQTQDRAQEQTQARIQDQTREQAQERLQLRDGSGEDCPRAGVGQAESESGNGTQDQLRAGV